MFIKVHPAQENKRKESRKLNKKVIEKIDFIENPVEIRKNNIESHRDLLLHDITYSLIIMLDISKMKDNQKRYLWS